MIGWAASGEHLGAAERERAEARMRKAKAQWTDAALAAQRGDKNAPALADAAMVELGAAREVLLALDNVEQGQ